MKTLSAWIVGIFGLGLGVGSVISGSASSDLTTTDLEAALDAAPDVDCGEGREALLEPVNLGGTRSFKVRCIPTQQQRPARALSPAPPPVLAPHVAAAPPPAAPVVATSPMSAPEPEAVETYEDDNDSRSWKQSAVVIGGSAGAGAGVGAIAKGKKGAAVGAAIGAVSGAAYELLKRDRKN